MLNTVKENCVRLLMKNTMAKKKGNRIVTLSNFLHSALLHYGILLNLGLSICSIAVV